MVKAQHPRILALSVLGLGVIALLAWGIPIRAQMSPYKVLSRVRLMPNTRCSWNVTALGGC